MSKEVTNFSKASNETSILVFIIVPTSQTIYKEPRLSIRIDTHKKQAK